MRKENTMAGTPRFSQTARFSLATGLALALGLVGFGLLSSEVNQASGAVCMGSDPFGECFQNFTPHAGEFPFGITIDENAGRVVTVDLYSGIAYKYEKADVNSAAPQFIFGPLGGGLSTGIEWHPVEDNYYWIIDDGTGPQLVRSDTQGVLIMSFPLASPTGGMIGDLTYSPTTETFWAIDFDGDICFEFDNTGVTTGNMFNAPTRNPFGGGDFGLGITITAGTAAVPVQFDIPTGNPVDLRASRVMRTSDTGVPQGLNFALSGGNNLTGWVTGLAYSEMSGFDTDVPPDGIPDGPAVEFIADVVQNRIVEVKVGTGDPLLRFTPTVIDLGCSADEDGNVTLSWTNPAPFTMIEIFRSEIGVQGSQMLISTLTGAETNPGPQTTMDPMLTGGRYSYEFQATTADPNGLLSNNETCEVVVGVGRLLNSTSHNGSNPLAITVVESPTFAGGDPADDAGLVYVVDIDTGVTHRYTKELILVDTILSPLIDCGPMADQPCTTTGIAWNRTTDTLFWYESVNGRLVETDLLGVATATPANLSSPAGGAIGDIAYAVLTQTFWGVDITQDIYFEFDAMGVATGDTISFEQLGVGTTGGFGNGVTVVDDASLVALDIPVGPSSGSFTDRIVRVITDGTLAGDPVFLETSTLSGFVNGVAWTASGSAGSPSEYVVGNDTNTIYEISLASSGNPFRRGDVNDSGSVEVADIPRLIAFIFNTNTDPLPCQDAGDLNDDGQINIPDIIVLVNGIFMPGVDPQPQAPFPFCGVDMTPSILTCTDYTSCP